MANACGLLYRAGLILVFAALVMAPARMVQAGTLFVTSQGDDLDLSGFTVGADDQFFVGTRFYLPYDARLSDSGGNFAQFGGGGATIFGAVTQLSGPSDFPNSIDLSTSDVIGTTLLTLPSTSGSIETIRGALDLHVSIGWYGMWFGSGKFGATAGTGVASLPTDNTPIGTVETLQPTPRSADHCPAGWRRASPVRGRSLGSERRACFRRSGGTGW